MDDVELALCATQVLVGARLVPDATVLIGGGGRILDVVRSDAVDPSVPVRVLADGVLSAGLVDLQVNGFSGVDFATVDREQWDGVCGRLAATGVTSFLATLISAPIPELVARIESLSALRRQFDGDARCLGVHVEGPFIAPDFRGAHAADVLCTPAAENVAALLSAGDLALVTLAPELPGAIDAIRQLTAAHVVVALGHSGASSGQTRAAIDAGATMVTHVFNAMGPLHHREPGLVGVALTDPRLTLGLICDFEHVCESVCSLVLGAAAGRVALVSDAVAAAGRAPGVYRLGGSAIHVAAGRAPIRVDGTLAGSVLTLDAAVRNAVACGLDAAAAITAATLVPARVLGRQDIGDLRPDSRADLVWWAPDLTLREVWVGGRALKDPDTA